MISVLICLVSGLKNSFSVYFKFIYCIFSCTYFFISKRNLLCEHPFCERINNIKVVSLNSSSEHKLYNQQYFDSEIARNKLACWWIDQYHYKEKKYSYVNFTKSFLLNYFSNAVLMTTTIRKSCKTFVISMKEIGLNLTFI